MDSKTHKSAVLTSTTKSDVLRSGGEVAITDLWPFKIKDLIAADYRIYRAEVAQVLTLSITNVTPAAYGKYSVLLGNVRHEHEGGPEHLRKYSYVGGSSAPTKAQIVDGLAARINADTGNYVTAVSDGIDKITITDDAGYYPARPSSRTGPTEYKLIDDLDSSSGATMTVTTPGVVSYGEGQRLIDDEPVIEPMTGNLASGEYDAPTGAVAGQHYSGFYITYSKSVGTNAIPGLEAKKILRQLVYVDDGTGSSTANATGYAAFLREFERIQYQEVYGGDPNAIVEMFEEVAVLTDGDGNGVPSSGDGDENLINIGGNQLGYHCIGATATDPAGSDITNGFDITRGTETDNQGIEVSANIGALAPQEFIVGKQDFSLRVQLSITDVLGTDDLVIGFRKKEAYQAAVDDYDEMAAFNVISGDVYIDTILNGGVTASDDTAKNFANTETHVLEVQVDKAGLVTFLVDDVDVSAKQSSAFSFDADEVVIPFIYKLAATALAGSIYIKKLYSVANIFTK